MRFTQLAAASLLCVLVSCSGGSQWGVEMEGTTPAGAATMFHTEAVKPGLAQKIFDAMIGASYNFASNLPEQIDRVNGRLTLRLGNDNQDSIAAILADGESDGAVKYMHGLANMVSQTAGGEAVDIILCRADLSDEFYTVAWPSE